MCVIMAFWRNHPSVAGDKERFSVFLGISSRMGWPFIGTPSWHFAFTRLAFSGRIQTLLLRSAFTITEQVAFQSLPASCCGTVLVYFFLDLSH